MIFLTILLITFNGYLYCNIYKKLPKKSILNYSFFLLTLKIILSLRLFPTNNFIILLDFIITRVIFYMLIFYFIQNIFPKKMKKIRIISIFSLTNARIYDILISVIITVLV